MNLMEDINLPELKENDNEFMFENSHNEINQNNVEINDGPSRIYDPTLFQKKIIIDYFQNDGIFLKNVFIINVIINVY